MLCILKKCKEKRNIYEIGFINEFYYIYLNYCRFYRILNLERKKLIFNFVNWKNLIILKESRRIKVDLYIYNYYNRLIDFFVERK